MDIDFFFLKKKQNKTKQKTIGFTPYITEQLLRGMKLTRKKSTKKLKHTRMLFRKNLQIKGVS